MSLALFTWPKTNLDSLRQILWACIVYLIISRLTAFAIFYMTRCIFDQRSTRCKDWFFFFLCEKGFYPHWLELIWNRARLHGITFTGNIEFTVQHATQQSNRFCTNSLNKKSSQMLSGLINCFVSPFHIVCSTHRLAFDHQTERESGQGKHC